MFSTTPWESDVGSMWRLRTSDRNKWEDFRQDSHFEIPLVLFLHLAWRWLPSVTQTIGTLIWTPLKTWKKS